MTRTNSKYLTVIGITFLSVSVMTAGGCSDASSDNAGAQSHGQPQVDSNSPASSTAANLPEGLFLAAAPSEAMSLLQAKTSASVGEQVAFEARIGGRVEPFAEGSAVFLVADRSIPTCTELHGHGCPTPWDYCCEPKDNLLKNMATVQIVDEAGRPLRGTVKGVGSLDPMAEIVVVGTVSQSEGPAFVVNASQIYVKSG